MKFLWLSLLAAAPLASAQGYEMKSYLNLNGPQPAAFWCDAPGRVLAVTQPVVQPAQMTNQPQPVRLVQWTGPSHTWQNYQLGPADPGAGQIYTALTPAGQQVSDSPQYFIHSSNIENVNDPGYRMTHINGFKVPAGTFGCRYKPNAAFIGATARHSITVWETGSKVTYSSSNRDGTAGTYLTGGSHIGSEYRWNRNGYTYALKLDDPGATLSVLRGDKLLSKETFQAYSVSVRK
ncbi:hypothetical protein GCM10022631_14750 [Deinococcus rubellus]|uniref:Uncharacterized protein n=1 Tax=Deinococcus rubellus TaxID=1889240 RepID=A0ABY5YIH4_9DEIO|nr:hypothetical protein [Deinococcus rubellus]UWX64925.1 hypothetical protein N0D28_04495 [Deinococcus rubellus]